VRAVCGEGEGKDSQTIRALSNIVLKIGFSKMVSSNLIGWLDTITLSQGAEALSLCRETVHKTVQKSKNYLELPEFGRFMTLELYCS